MLSLRVPQLLGVHAFAGVFSLAIVGCGAAPELPPAAATQAPDALRARAASDLRCAGPIEARALSANTSLVSGCGREATYVEQCAACGGSSGATRDYACACVYSLEGEIRPN